MYKIFSKYVLRTPIFPINYYFNLTKDQTITDKKLLQEFENPVIKEAIYLASPILFKEIEKWSEKKIKEAKEINKIRISFLKYLSRLSSRATPFGLFSGSCLGKISDVDFIKIHKSHNRNTRLDMNLTGLLIKKLERDIEIKNNLLFYPNTSIYTCGYQLRYVESNYNKELLTYQIVEIDNSEYLTEIFNSCKNGLTILDISNVIVDSDISLEEATNFVHDLIGE